MPATANRNEPAAQPVPLIPFTAAAHEHTESGGFSFSVTPGANAQSFGPFDVPSFGFLRHLVIQAIGAGGTAGPGVLAADSPFNLFSSISLSDVNGAPIFGPLNGYEAFLANAYGGYVYQSDPRDEPGYANSLTAPQFLLRIPIEISHHDGLGSLANQNAAAAYKVALTVDSLTNIYATSPTTAPTYTISGYLEAWTLPNNVDLAGRPQAQFPPAHGTTQYWSKFVKTISVGQNSILLPRVGNLLRNVLIIARNSTTGAGVPNGTRADNVFLDPIRLAWDQRDLVNESQYLRVQKTWERTVSVARDTGVFAFSFDHALQGKSGDGPPNLWLPTTQATRLEFSGPAAAAGTLTILTNDIAPVEVTPSERYSEGSVTGAVASVPVATPRGNY